MTEVVKFCRHCRKDHPLTAEYWFKNGGILRKCKEHYKKYEQVRYHAGKTK